MTKPKKQARPRPSTGPRGKPEKVRPARVKWDATDAQALKDALGALGLTRTALANAVGCSPSRVGELTRPGCKNWSAPSPRLKAAIDKHLNKLMSRRQPVAEGAASEEVGT